MRKKDAFGSIHFQKSAAFERKGNATRARILDAAVNVIASEGVEGASIQAITKFASIANGTFYIHFANKNEMLEHLGIAVIDAISRSVHDPAYDHPDAAHLVARHLFMFMAVAGAEPSWIPLILDSLKPTEKNCATLERGVRDDVQRGTRSGRFDVSESREVIGLILAICRTGLERIRDGGDLKTVQRHAIEAGLRLLGVEPKESRAIAEGTIDLPLWDHFVFPVISNPIRP